MSFEEHMIDDGFDDAQDYMDYLSNQADDFFTNYYERNDFNFNRKPNIRTMQLYDWDTVLNFGKYKGETIKEVFNKDAQYIYWAFNDIETFCPSEEVFKSLKVRNTEMPILKLKEKKDLDIEVKKVLDEHLERYKRKVRELNSETMEELHEEIEYLKNENNSCCHFKKKIDGGTDGKIQWIFYDDCTLEICGDGCMPNYYYVMGGLEIGTKSPWNSYLDSIVSIIIEDGITSVGYYAFCNCSKLTSIIIPNSVVKIGDCAFNNCCNLTSITIPENVKRIGKFAFSNCENLQIVNYNAINCELMGCSMGYSNDSYAVTDTVFSNCNAFAVLNIGKLVKTIPYGAFYECCGLNSVIIPKNVTSIKDGAFFGCINLVSIVIPESIATIDESVFRGCDNLKHFCVQRKIPPTTTNDDYERYWYPSNDINKDICVLHVPIGSKNQYTNADYWKEFKTINDDIGKPIVKVVGIDQEAIYENDKVYHNVYFANYPRLDFSETVIKKSCLENICIESLFESKFPGMIKKVECEPYEIIDTKTGEKKILIWKNEFFPNQEE